MIELPEMGQVYYYRSDQEIPVGNPAVVIPSNTMYALYKTAKNKFMLITPKVQTNVDGLAAQDIAQAGGLVKKEMAENKKTAHKGILESLLFEAESAIKPAETDPVVVQDVSLDQKVDKYLVRYERESIPSSAMYDTEMAGNTNVATPEGGNVNAGGPNPAPAKHESKKPANKGILESILFEADPGLDPTADAGGGDLGGFGGGDAGAGGDDAPATSPDAGAPKSPPVIDTPKMNMNSYCRAVARLVDNYEALLDPKTTIFNRAKEYIRVNYDEATAKMFEEVMEQQFGVTPTPAQRDQRMAPPAANAIYSGGGGGGGG